MKVKTRIEIEFANVTLPIVQDRDGREIVPLKPISDVFGLRWEDQRKKTAPELPTCTPDNRGAGNEILQNSGDLPPETLQIPVTPSDDTTYTGPEKRQAQAGTPDNQAAGTYLGRLLGACIAPVPFAGQIRDMLCIRLDRVAAWMMQINPERVRAAGNTGGADFLELKHEEWADLLHEYEARQGGMLAALSGETRAKAINVRLYLSVLRAKRDTTNEGDRKALESLAKTLASDAGAPYQPDLIDQK